MSNHLITVQQTTTHRVGSPKRNTMFRARWNNEGIDVEAYATEKVQAIGRLIVKIAAIGLIDLVDEPALDLTTGAELPAEGGAT